MRARRKSELYDLVKILAEHFACQDIAVLLGVSPYHVHRTAQDLGIEFHPAPVGELLAKTMPAIAERCEDFRAGRIIVSREANEFAKA